MTLLLGIDDAGRGPIMGPMILAGVLIEKKDSEPLKKTGVADSKTLTHLRRLFLYEKIKEKAIKYHMVKAFPEEIDSSLASGINLNTLEAKKTAEIINEINVGRMQKNQIKVIVDCPSVNIQAWMLTLKSFINNIDNLDVVCEHKADANHPVVSAASILAKCTREEEVGKIQKQYGSVGSGYPSDPYTKEFLVKKGKELSNSGIFRKSWATWKNLYPKDSIKKGQSTLTGF